MKPEDKQPDEKVEIRIRPEIARALRAYGEYASGSSSSHVVTAALKRLFREDKGFQKFQEANPAAGQVKSAKDPERRRGRSQGSGVNPPVSFSST